MYRQCNDIGYAVGFMAPWQKELLRNHAGKIVCLDATHGTNSQRCYLYTTVIQHKSLFGIPCSYLFTNDESRITLRFWLEFLKDKGALS